MEGRVEGKVAIVTGAASGLGAAASAALAREGARVVLTDVNTEAGEALAKKIGGSAYFAPHDVRLEEAWTQVIGDATERFGGLDVLVNNAGVAIVATIEDTTLEQLRFIEAVNLEGPFLGCKHAIPAMAASGGGSIINISSTAGLVGTPPFAAYSATKGALRSITQTVAVHCKRRKNGVRCNSIHPGGIATAMTQNLRSALGETSRLALSMMGSLTTEPVGDPEDIAAAVVYLASDESRFVNGSHLAVDNALTAS